MTQINYANPKECAKQTESNAFNDYAVSLKALVDAVKKVAADTTSIIDIKQAENGCYSDSHANFKNLSENTQHAYRVLLLSARDVYRFITSRFSAKEA